MTIITEEFEEEASVSFTSTFTKYCLPSYKKIPTRVTVRVLSGHAVLATTKFLKFLNAQSNYCKVILHSVKVD